MNNQAAKMHAGELSGILLAPPPPSPRPQVPEVTLVDWEGVPGALAK